MKITSSPKRRDAISTYIQRSTSVWFRERRLFRFLRMQGLPRRSRSGSCAVRMVVNIGTRLITTCAVTEGPTRDEYSRTITRKTRLGPASRGKRGTEPHTITFRWQFIGRCSTCGLGFLETPAPPPLRRGWGGREVGGHWPQSMTATYYLSGT